MEQKINREVMDYQETIAGGLTLRQFFWAGIAVAISVYIYFRLSSTLSTEVISWLCILAAAPPALMGFVKWHGMTADQVLILWIRYLIAPKKLPWKSTNQYFVITDILSKQNRSKGVIRKNVKNIKNNQSTV